MGAGKRTSTEDRATQTQTMIKPEKIQVLHLEDNPLDAELIRMAVEAELECELVQVRNGRDFETTFASHAFDLVLCDYAVPGYNGFSALKFAREKSPEIPFILLSGTLGEDQAVESLKSGATDYLVKQRLTRLGPAIRRAMAEAAARRERQQAEARLREQAALLDKARDAILVCDSQQGITFWNAGAQRLYGWSPVEVLGKNLSQVLFGPEATTVQQVLEGVAACGEWFGEQAQITRDGKTVTVQSHWTSMRDDTNTEASFLIINTDITEKKTLEAQYLRAQRLESIGILASGIAHDLNNVLSPILMGAQLLRMTIEDPQAKGPIDAIENSAQHGADLIKQILAFGRGVGGESVEIQLGHLIRDVQKMLRDTFPKSIDFQVKIPRDLWTIKAVSTQMHQVLMNLCVNARDAMLPAGGRLDVRAENVLIDEHYAGNRPDAKPGPYVMVTVGDTGSGMAPEVLQRIYDPFFTTKEVGKGTGLGLSTVMSIVKNHSGFIHVYSELDRGTRFRVYIPAVGSEAVSNSEQHQLNLPRGRGECILVVDDEAEIRQITTRTLEKYGYRTLNAKDGAEGLATYVARQPEIDLVLTDMMMPLMGGAALIRALKRLDPTIKIVAFSGMVENLDRDSLVSIPLIDKPFGTEQLLNTLREELDKRR